MAHELQHAIQAIEGHAGGSSPAFYRDKDVLSPEWDEFILNTQLGGPKSADYKRVADFEKRPDYLDLEDLAEDIWMDNDFPARLDELRADLFNAKGNDDYDGIDEATEKIRSLKEYYVYLLEEVDPDLAEYKRLNLVEGIHTNGPSKWLTANEAYEKTAGEVEAVNVERRLDYTPQVRRGASPKVTQSVPDEVQIRAEDYYANGGALRRVR